MPSEKKDGRYRLRAGDRVFPIPTGEAGLLVGRGEGADVLLDEPTASRRHLAVKVLPDGRLVVEQLNPANGYLVNGARATGTKTLAHGDRIGIGRSVLIVLDTTERSQTTRQASPGSYDLETEIGRLEQALRHANAGEAADRAASTLVAVRGRMIDATLRARLEAALLALGGEDRVWLAPLLELCAAEQALLSSATVARMHELARMGRGPHAVSLRQYLSAMATRTPHLSTSEQVLLRRIEALARSPSDG
jgi:hypothetical protein